MIGRFVALPNGRGLMVEIAPHTTRIVIRTDHAITWWQYVLDNADTLTNAVGMYLGDSQIDIMSVAISSFDDRQIVELAREAWEEAPDEVTGTEAIGYVQALGKVLGETGY